MMHLNDTTGCVKGQHLTLHERIEIQAYKHLKYSNRFIAKVYTTYKLYHLVAQVRATSSVVESHPIAT